MKASELVAKIQALIAAHGDLKMFCGDMGLLEDDCVDVVDTTTDDPTEREHYGEQYFYLVAPE